MHRGAAAAGARWQRFLIVYRHAAISLAGLAIDPANLLLLLQRSPHLAGQLAGGERVCSNLFEEGQWAPGTQVGQGERFAVRLRSEMTGNRISVLTR